jgi:hypothetical protein
MITGELTSRIAVGKDELSGLTGEGIGVINDFVEETDESHWVFLRAVSGHDKIGIGYMILEVV